MSVVTHVIPQSFSDGQLLNIVTPTIAQPQELLVAQAGDPGQVIPMTLTTAIAPIHLEQKLDASLEREKQAIYKHPLFPLMALMFERCEQASASPDFPCENFDTDIQAFILHQEKERKSFYSNDPDLDTLMIKSIQVLRIHLLELEKVTELCKDFCTRYTNCLKGKLQSENLLRTESDYDQSMFDEPPKESPQSVQNIVTTVAGGVILQQPFQSSVPAMQTLGPGQIMSGGTVYQMVQTPQGLVAQPIQIQSTLPSLSTPVIHGGTPLSQIGVASTHSLVSTSSSNTVVNTIGSMNYDSDDDDCGKKKNKRGVLPKSATQVMKSWLFQHIVHPYPTEDEKRQIATQTNLTLLQVNNWFINARRRILQPMLDAGNPDQAKAKKAKPQSKPPQRFWPFGGVPDKSTTTSVSKQDAITSSPPSTTNVTTMGQTIVLPPGSFVMPDGQIMNLQGAANMAAMLNQVKQTSPSPSSDKDFSDNNNNSHNTDNDDLGDSEDMT